MISLKKVVVDDLYETIHGYVTKCELIVDDYDSMVEVILSMIKEGYCFSMDRDILRDAMESLTYMYAPSDDMNKDRLVQQFADEDDDDNSEDDEQDSFGNGEDFNNMDLMKMMQMMGGMGGMGDLANMAGMGNTTEQSSNSEKEEKCPEGTCELNECGEGACDEGECKKVTTDTNVSTSDGSITTTVVKEDAVVEEAKVDEERSSTPVNDDNTAGAE